MRKNSFLMYTKYKKQIDKLSNEQAGEFIKAVFAYQCGEELPEMDCIVDMLFSMVEADFEEDAAKWEETCKARSIAGSKGGRPRKDIASFDKANESKKSISFNSFSEKAKKAEYEYEYEYELEKENKKEKEIRSDVQFEDFWNAYPRIMRRKKTEDAFVACIKAGADPSSLVTAAKNYAADVKEDGTDEQYIKCSDNFLMDNTWMNYLPGVWVPKKKKAKKNAFNDMENRTQYNFAELEALASN